MSTDECAGACVFEGRCGKAWRTDTAVFGERFENGHYQPVYDREK